MFGVKVVIVLGKNPKNIDDLEELKKRVEKGIEIFYKNSCSFLILSGGAQTHYGKNEADLMEEMALIHGFPKEKIIKEASSVDTVENAFFCKKLLSNLKVDRAYIISSDYHMDRVKLSFDAFLPSIDKIYISISIGKKEEKQLIEKTLKKIKELLR